MNSIASVTRLASLSATDSLLAACEMRQLLRELEPKTNLDRKISPKIIQAFKDAGFFRLVQPTRFGGFDADYDLCTQIIEEITQGCPSSAWVYGVLSLHHFFLSAWPRDVQEEIWRDDPNVLISSSLSPRPIVRSEGGYSASGDWSFSSGCDHAGWAMLGGIPKGEAPCIMLVPLSSVSIDDDWHTLGLRGTGSKTLRLKDVFIPDRHTVPLSSLYSGSRGSIPSGGSFWDLAPLSLFGTYNFSCVILGLARRAVETTTEILKTRVSRGVKLGEVDAHRMKLAQAMSITDIARFQMQSACRQHVANLRAGAIYGPKQVSAVARDNAVLVRQLRDVVLTLTEVSGSWIYDHDPMQQLVRDILTGATHRSASWEAYVLPNAQYALQDGTDA